MEKLKPFLVFAEWIDTAAVVIAEDEEDAQAVLRKDPDLIEIDKKTTKSPMRAKEIVKGADTIKCLKKGCLTWLYA